MGLGDEVPDCDLVRPKAPTAPYNHHHKAIHANTEPYTVCIVVYCFFSHGHACSCGHLKTPRLSWTQRHTKGGHPDANAPAFALGRPGRGFLIVQSKFELWLFVSFTALDHLIHTTFRSISAYSSSAPSSAHEPRTPACDRVRLGARGDMATTRPQCYITIHQSTINKQSTICSLPLPLFQSDRVRAYAV